MRTSQIPKFYKLSTSERQNIIAEQLNKQVKDLPLTNSLSLDQASLMIENVIGTYNLPLAIATNFLINNQDYLIPMVTEEPSVVAAVSSAAKAFREAGGFSTSSDKPITIGQIQLLDITNIDNARAEIITRKHEIIGKANETSKTITAKGGGAQDIEIRTVHSETTGTMLILHLLYDTQDAMGANAVNTSAEHITPLLEEITGGRANLRILSNLSDRRKARATGKIPEKLLTSEKFSGHQVTQLILEAAAFAQADPYRAATHNKGIMNGIDAMALATGNDWRALEAGAHAYAARNGQYTSLSHWWIDEEGNLNGSLELPMAVGIVGGATRVHPTAQLALEILNVKSAQALAEIMTAVGLAQNFAAIRALATEGIQHGHMRMHARQIALAAGAPTEAIAEITRQLITEKNIHITRAQELTLAWKEHH